MNLPLLPNLISLPAVPQSTQRAARNIISAIHKFSWKCLFCFGYSYASFRNAYIRTHVFNENSFYSSPKHFTDSSHVASINKVVLLFRFARFLYPTLVVCPFTMLSSSSRKFVTSIRRPDSLYRFADAKSAFPLLRAAVRKKQKIAQIHKHTEPFYLNMCGRPERKRALAEHENRDELTH